MGREGTRKREEGRKDLVMGREGRSIDGKGVKIF